MRGLNAAAGALCACLLVLAGCEQAPMRQPGSIPGTEKQGVRSRATSYRLNPSPTRWYEVTLDARHAPGRFGWVEADAHYRAEDCRFAPGRFTSLRVSPSVDVPLRSRVEGENLFRARIALDGMQDGDYFGRGTCHWKLVTVSFAMRATADPADTLFVAAIAREAIEGDVPERFSYRRAKFPRSDIEGDIDIGDGHLQRRRPPEQELFSASLTATRSLQIGAASTMGAQP